MDFYKEILAAALSKHEIKVTFENLSTENPGETVESASYKTPIRIRHVLDNDALQDFDCIEEIVRLLEDAGIGGGIRHDF